MSSARSLLVFVALGMVAPMLGAPSCPVGPSSLVGADVTARVILSRMRAGDFVTARLGDEEHTFVANTSTSLTLHFSVAPGVQSGSVVHLRDGLSRCADFTLLVEEERAAEIALDVENLSRCAPERDAGIDDSGIADAGPDDAGGLDAGPDDAGIEDAGERDAGIDDAGELDAGVDGGDDDAGVESDAGLVDGGPLDGGPPPVIFVLFSEDVRLGLCVVEPCHVTTTVTADGTLTYKSQGDDPLVGSVSMLDVEALTAELVNPSADALFAGSDPLCSDPPPGALDTVLLRRVLDEPPLVDVTKDVSGCLSTTVLGLRTRVSQLRLTALGIE